MSSKHTSAPWFSAPEVTQASLMLEAVREEISVPPSSQQPTEFRLPTQEEISTIPLNPSTEEAAPDDSLPFTQDVEEDDDPPELSPEQEQELLDVEEEKEERAKPPSPGLEAFQKAFESAPSDRCTWEYARNVQGTIMSRYLKGDDPSRELAAALVRQDLPSMSGDSSDTPPAEKPKPDDGAPSM